MTDLIPPTLDILEKEGPIHLDQPPGRLKEACPLTNGKQELKGQNDLGEKYQGTV